MGVKQMSKQYCLQRSLILIVLSSLLFLMFFSRCSVKAPEGSGVPPAPLNPSVAASFPDRVVLDEAVPINAAIQVAFDQDMNERTICASNIYLSTLKTDPVTGAEYAAKIPCLPPVTVNGIVTMKPFAHLVDGQTYTLTVTDYVSNREGSKLPSTLNWNFVAKDIGRLRVKQNDTALVSGEYSHALGNMFMNASTENVSFELENYGTKDIEILSVGLSGDNPGDFIATGTSISTVGKEDSESFTIRFFPTGTGEKTATVTIQYRDGTIEPAGTGTFTFEVTGYGLPMPDFMVGYLTNPADPGSFIPLLPAVGEYDFGSLVLGNSSDPLTMAIKNTRSSGGAPISITGVSCANSDFVLNTSGLNASIPAEGMTTFTAVYTPTAFIAEVTAALVVMSPDVEEGNYSVDLTGNCRSPEIEISNGEVLVSGDTINFDDLADYYAGMAGQSITLTVKNSGNGDLILTDNPVLTGDNADEFTISAGPGSGTHIAAGSSSTITIDFTPGSGGAKTAALEVKSDDLDEAAYLVNFTVTVKALDSITISDVGTAVTEVELGNSVQLKATGNYEGTILNVTEYVTWSLSGDGGGNLTANASSVNIDTDDRGDIVVGIDLDGKSDSYSFNCYETGSIRFNFNSTSEVASYGWSFVNGSGGLGWYWGDSSGFAGADSLGCGQHDVSGTDDPSYSEKSEGAFFLIPYDFSDITGDIDVKVRVCSTSTGLAWPFLKVYVSENGGSSYSKILDQAHSDNGWHEWEESGNVMAGDSNCVIKVLYDHYAVAGKSLCLWMDWLEINGNGKFRH